MIFTTDRVLFYLFVSFLVAITYTNNFIPPEAWIVIDWFGIDLLHQILGVISFFLLIEFVFALSGAIIFPKKKRKIRNKHTDAVTQAKLNSRAKSFPPPYPNGWYRVLNSEELKKGEIKHVHLCGTHFAIYRGENGKPAILDAFCPHLGANLAVGGKVVKNEVVCPFHGWKFNDQGECTGIPYAQCVPKVAKTESYPVIEYAKMICVYYDVNKRPPAYEPDPLPEIESGKFVYHGEWAEEVDMHIQDFSENSADFAHFDFLHGEMSIPFFKKFLFIRHKLDWVPGSPEQGKECFSYFYDTATVHSHFFPSFHFPRIVSADITFNGPAGIVYFRFKTMLGDVLLIKTFQPLAPLTQLVQDRYYADPFIPAFLVRFICREALKAFCDDIFVWGNKSYSFKPILVKEDGPVKAVRRWYSQFYCKESVSMVDALNLTSSPTKNDIEW